MSAAGATESFRTSLADTADVAALRDTFVVPRYLAPAGEMLLDLLAINESAQIAHLGCRTGFPDAEILARLAGATLYGCDPSASAVQLAQSKASAGGLSAEYLVAESTSTPFPRGAFTHGVALDVAPDARAAVLAELERLLVPGGQLLVTTLLRGSAQELTCLLREYAVAYDRAELSRGLDRWTTTRPTPEMLAREIEALGFDYIEVEHQRIRLRFQSGRDFLDDPVCKLVLFPEAERNLRTPLAAPLEYVRKAIDRYWATAALELPLSIGCVSARKR